MILLLNPKTHAFKGHTRCVFTPSLPGLSPLSGKSLIARFVTVRRVFQLPTSLMGHLLSLNHL